ncbi:MAG: hypothetical protein C4523_18335 [Myxococcales bacterium]|nr:MAG: hypothetical protein C4523_18335 [Myxococcales bacterium]
MNAEPKGIELYLSGGKCVECAARRRYQELLTRLMALDEVSREQNEEFNLLRRFLKCTDFERLREVHPLLDGRSGLTIVVCEGPALNRFVMKTRKWDRWKASYDTTDEAIVITEPKSSGRENA